MLLVDALNLKHKDEVFVKSTRKIVTVLYIVPHISQKIVLITTADGENRVRTYSQKEIDKKVP